MSAEKYENPLLVQQSFDDFCHLPNVLLRNFGLNFNQDPDSKCWNNFRKCFLVLGIMAHFYCFSMLVLSFFILLIREEVNLSHLLKVLEGVNYSVFGTMKFFAISLNFKKWGNIYTTLADIYPKTRKEKVAYRVRQHFWPRWMLIILYIYIISVALITISPLVESLAIYAFQRSIVGVTDPQFAYGTLYGIDYGFDRHQPLNYVYTYIAEVFHANFIISCTVVGDILLLCFCLQLCMHFDFLARSLENYKPDVLAEAKDQQFIADFVKKHQILLK